MGRRAKNKQGVPPTFDEFQASKLKNDTKEKEMVLKNRKMIYRFLKNQSQVQVPASKLIVLKVLNQSQRLNQK